MLCNIETDGDEDRYNKFLISPLFNYITVKSRRLRWAESGNLTTETRIAYKLIWSASKKRQFRTLWRRLEDNIELEYRKIVLREGEVLWILWWTFVLRKFIKYFDQLKDYQFLKMCSASYIKVIQCWTAEQLGIVIRKSCVRERFWYMVRYSRRMCSKGLSLTAINSNKDIRIDPGPLECVTILDVCLPSSYPVITFDKFLRRN